MVKIQITIFSSKVYSNEFYLMLTKYHCSKFFKKANDQIPSNTSFKRAHTQAESKNWQKYLLWRTVLDAFCVLWFWHRKVTNMITHSFYIFKYDLLFCLVKSCENPDKEFKIGHMLFNLVMLKTISHSCIINM